MPGIEADPMAVGSRGACFCLVRAAVYDQLIVAVCAAEFQTDQSVGQKVAVRQEDQKLDQYQEQW